MQVNDPPNLRKSYSLNTLYRIEMVQRVINRTTACVNEAKNELEEKLNSMSERNDLLTQIGCAEMRMNNLKSELNSQKEKLQAKINTKLKIENDIFEKNVDMLNKFQQLKLEKEKLNDKRRKTNENKERLVKTKAHLNLRRKEMVNDLRKFYPIVQFPDGKGYSICDVFLPNSEDFQNRDQVMISIALGYVSHVLVLIHNFLDLPMRYQIIYFGSRSSICDHINERISEVDRQFPLHSKSGKENIYFKYGVFLLNKNIAQLRQLFGMSTTDLSATLPNLFTLLRDKLSIDEPSSDNDHNTSINIGTNNYSFPGKINDFLSRELEIMTNEQEQIFVNQ